MIKILPCILIIFILQCNVAYAEIKIFLKPKAIISQSGLTLCDIASVEGNNSETDRIKNINIDSDLFTDGYIDKKEIFTLLKSQKEDSCIIYGNAVRIVPGELQTDNLSGKNDLRLKKGDRVDVIVNNKGISLKLKGIAVNEGKFNEEITVKIENKSAFAKFIKVKIIGRDTVEVNI